MTVKKEIKEKKTCLAQVLLKTLSDKWKPEIFHLALDSSVRFSNLLREIKESNKQTLSVVLRELEQAGLLEKVIIKEKPLHIEYYLTENGKSFASVFKQLELLRPK
ncbi:MAG: helix-turn-helix transcriptional regulator [Crocinitomicaceae bacterium]|nr:helix-turn-helix transcriptional regulator [Crocinitomicaceae bacterium]